MSQQDLFAVEGQLRKIHELSSFLPKLAEVVDFEMFRPDLSVLREAPVKGKGGRPPFDVVLMGTSKNHDFV